MSEPRRNTMHAETARVLRDRIATGIYQVNELLPPEVLLAAEFNLSRHTVRAAMKALVDEGLIERQPGRGTVVSPRKPGGTWGVKSINDLIGEFNESQIVVLKKGSVLVKTCPDVIPIFKLRANASVFSIERVISTKDGPMALNRLYTHPRYAVRLPADKIGYTPLIELIEEHCRVEAVRTRQVATALAATPHMATMLGIRPGSPLLALRRTYLDRDDEPIEYTELLCRPDRYEQKVDFLREKRSTQRRSA
jgi:GntR family transcriptional regulator